MQATQGTLDRAAVVVLQERPIDSGLGKGTCVPGFHIETSLILEHLGPDQLHIGYTDICHSHGFASHFLFGQLLQVGSIAVFIKRLGMSQQLFPEVAHCHYPGLRAQPALVDFWHWR